MLLILCTQHCSLVPKHFHPQTGTPGPSAVSPPPAPSRWTVPVKGLLRSAL